LEQDNGLANFGSRDRDIAESQNETLKPVFLIIEFAIRKSIL
jgi:hypothetical protein